MDNETKEFINKQLNRVQYEDYTEYINKHIKKSYPMEICKIEEKTVYPLRDYRYRCAGYICEDGEIKGDLNTLFGLYNESSIMNLEETSLIITKEFYDTIFLLKKSFRSAGTLNSNLTNEQYNQLSRAGGLETIIILLNPGIENRILTYKLIKRLYPLFNLRVCKLEKAIKKYNKEELEEKIINSLEVQQQHFLNVDKYLNFLEEYKWQKVKVPNFEELYF